jgi:hypothetical protein
MRKIEALDICLKSARREPVTEQEIAGMEDLFHTTQALLLEVAQAKGFETLADIDLKVHDLFADAEEFMLLTLRYAMKASKWCCWHGCIQLAEHYGLFECNGTMYRYH